MLLDDCENTEIENIFSQLKEKICSDLKNEETTALKFKREIELRYHGQSSALKLSWLDIKTCIDEFHQQHQRRYGYVLNMPVELVNVRLTASGQSAVIPPSPAYRDKSGSAVENVTVYELNRQVPVYKRIEMREKQELIGPAIIVEKEATLYIAPYWRASLQGPGGILLEQMDKI